MTKLRNEPLEQRVAALEADLMRHTFTASPADARALMALSKYRHEAHVVRVIRPIVEELQFLDLLRSEAK